LNISTSLTSSLIFVVHESYVILLSVIAGRCFLPDSFLLV